MQKYKVINTYRTEVSNPIKLEKDKTVICLRQSQGEWPDWILCRTENSEGWVPKQIIEKHETYGIVLENYDATEFNLDTGDILIAEKQLNGWIWGYKPGFESQKAWAPLNHLQEVPC